MKTRSPIRLPPVSDVMAPKSWYATKQVGANKKTTTTVTGHGGDGKDSRGPRGNINRVVGDLEEKIFIW